jgi:hypothetical protein
MSRRSLHNGYQTGGIGSTIASVFSSPAQFLSAVRTQLSNGYDAVRDRISQLTGRQQDSTSNSPTRGGTRFVRTSSQSSGSSGRSKGYNLRSRPVHSTPRDTDTDQQRKTTTKNRKDTHQGEIDEEDDDYDNHKRPQYYYKKVVHYLKKALHSPIDIFGTIWNKLKSLPWWILLPILLLLGLYACKLIFDFNYLYTTFFLSLLFKYLLWLVNHFNVFIMQK